MYLAYVYNQYTCKWIISVRRRRVPRGVCVPVYAALLRQQVVYMHYLTVTYTAFYLGKAVLGRRGELQSNFNSLKKNIYLIYTYFRNI